MAIRKLSDVNLMRLKKAFGEKLKEEGHQLTQFDLIGDEFKTQLTFEIDGFFKHEFNWESSAIIGKEFKDVVKEVLTAFNHEEHLERYGNK